MKNPAAFISYARLDDAAYGGRITGLRGRLQRLVAAAIGRDFEIFQDCEGIAWGKHWPTRLDEALEEAWFLIPILTPSYFNSENCRDELKTFLELERRLGRRDGILSLYFLDAPIYEQKVDPLAAILQDRQHRDWRHLRFDALGSPKVMRALDMLAREIAAAVHARQRNASPLATPLHSVAPSAAPGTMPAVPLDAEADPPPTGEPTRIRTSQDTSFRDIEAPWCPELTVIPSGSFVMGSQENEEGRDLDESPQHAVSFALPFALGRYLVTFEEYDHFCAGTGREPAPHKGWGRDRRPAIHVSWEDATAYCKWLSEQTGQVYRLPSEAEWEYACRAGTTTPFWTGATISTEQANYDGKYAYGSGRKGVYREQTTPVDAFAANPWGLHDMHGNVWEWCEDCWNESYAGAPRDGTAWLRGDCSLRVVRGGSWKYRPDLLRSALRGRHMSGGRDYRLGFRVSRTLGYHNPAFAGRVTFNYSNNDGRYSIGRGEFFFETMWSKASDDAIHLYADPDSISGIAKAPALRNYHDLGDPARYDMSSRSRTIQEDEHAVLKNICNHYAVLKILDIKDRTRSDSVDEVVFEFWILTGRT